MKRTLACLLAAAMLLLAACGDQTDGDLNAGETLPTEGAVSTPATGGEESETPDIAAPETVLVTLYLPDEATDYQYQKTLEVEAANGIQGILDALIQQGALAEGTTALSFRIDDDGETVSDGEMVSHTVGELHGVLDLSEEFLTGLQTGTTGELMYMASLVNTVIGHYDLADLAVTCQGAVIESGHQLYDQPMEMYLFD